MAQDTVCLIAINERTGMGAAKPIKRSVCRVKINTDKMNVITKQSTKTPAPHALSKVAWMDLNHHLFLEGSVLTLNYMPKKLLITQQSSFQ